MTTRENMAQPQNPKEYDRFPHEKCSLFHGMAVFMDGFQPHFYWKTPMVHHKFMGKGKKTS